MKIIPQYLFILLCVTTLPACAQIKYPARITVKVVDDAGAPITSGTVRTSTFAKWVRGEGFGHDEYDNFEAIINKEGIAIVEMSCLRSDIGYWPELNDSYYNGGGGRYRFKEVVNGRWEPWNPQLEIVVPRILNPIPLYARRLGFGPNVELPAAGPVGFDLLVSDWVAPHGRGKQADFIFTHSANLVAADINAPFDSTFTITFSHPADGIQSRLAKSGNRLLELPREAPESGYERKLERRVMWAGKGTRLETGTDKDQNYFFRVRSVQDSSGKIISALYGKIYGDFAFDVINSHKGYVQFVYYLNPVLLDRNLEFDPKRNLYSDKLTGTIGLGP